MSMSRILALAPSLRAPMPLDSEFPLSIVSDAELSRETQGFAAQSTTETTGDSSDNFSQDENNVLDSAVEPTESDPTPEPLTGYELVADMMRRQDEVIAEIDLLNERIESAIKAISAAREKENQASGEAGSTEVAPAEKAA